MTDLQSRLQGLWLPLITPFRDGELDVPSLRRLVRHYADGPVDGLILAATSGEGMALDAAELERLVALVRTEIDGRERHLPICLGLSGASTTKMLDAGCDGGLADRFLSDHKPLLHAAIAALPVAAFHRARRSRRAAASDLQHPLPHGGQFD